MTDTKKKKMVHFPSSPQILWHANTTRYTVCWYCLPTYVSSSSSLSSAFCITALKIRDSDNRIVKTGCLYELRKKKLGHDSQCFSLLHAWVIGKVSLCDNIGWKICLFYFCLATIIIEMKLLEGCSMVLLVKIKLCVEALPLV